MTNFNPKAVSGTRRTATSHRAQGDEPREEQPAPNVPRREQTADQSEAQEKMTGNSCTGAHRSQYILEAQSLGLYGESQERFESV
jgi:hypothetical protein